MITAVTATQEHLNRMIDIGLCESDLLEAIRFNGSTGADALKEAFRSTPNVYVAVKEDEPLAMFGVRPLGAITRDGVPWMLQTAEAREHYMAFGKISRHVFESMCAGYDHLGNWVDSENKKSINWLKWLGFDFLPEPMELGPFNHPFYYFYWRRA